MIEEKKTVVINGKEWYRNKIFEIVNRIDDVKLLKRIYDLSEYLYIHK